MKNPKLCFGRATIYLVYICIGMLIMPTEINAQVDPKKNIAEVIHIYHGLDSPRKLLENIVIIHPYTYAPVSDEEFKNQLEAVSISDTIIDKNAPLIRKTIKYISNIIKTDSIDYAYASVLTNITLTENAPSVAFNGKEVAKNMEYELRITHDKEASVTYNPKDRSFTQEFTSQLIMLKNKDVLIWRVYPVVPKSLDFIESNFPTGLLKYLQNE